MIQKKEKVEDFKNELILKIDLKPALTEEQLDARLIRDFDKFKRKCHTGYYNYIDKIL